MEYRVVGVLEPEGATSALWNSERDLPSLE